jgi:flavin reductase (DIM6/NTAB) family NADH-FMN oxidoreductase RutF
MQKITMTTFLDTTALQQMEQRKRAMLINSIGGYKFISLIGTIDENKNTNLAIFSSLFHLGANPALIGFIIRPDSVDRHTLSNILATKVYTVNHVNEHIYKQAHQTSARYEKEISEFDATGLTTEYKNDFAAPFVQESNIQMGVVFKERIDLTINGTILIIGEITQLYYPSDCICEDGFVDIEKANTITCSGLDSYHTTNRLARLSYAKPNEETITITSAFVE